MYPTSNESVEYREEWNDAVDDIVFEEANFPDDVSKEEASAFLESDFYNQSSKHALNNLSCPSQSPEDRAHSVIKNILSPKHPDYPNAVESLAKVYRLAVNIRENIESFNLGEAETQLNALTSYAAVLCEDISPQNSENYKGAPNLAKAEGSPSLLLSDSFKLFITVKSKGKDAWAGKQLSTNQRNAKTLITIIGDIPIKDIDAQVLDDAF